MRGLLKPLTVLSILSFATSAWSIDRAESYIVVLKPSSERQNLFSMSNETALTMVQASMNRLENRFRLPTPKHIFSRALHGGVYHMNAAQAKELAQDPDVDFIEKDQIAHANVMQKNPTWGLDRIDQVSSRLDGQYNFQYTGQGVNAYIIDTGMRITHREFEGRASYGYDFVDNDPVAQDCHGHGTHVAGTIGSRSYGVAKRTNLIAVRVLNCQGSGSYSGIIAGIDWVAAHHRKPAVANMSLGGGYSRAVEMALANAVKAGVTFAVAAGNSNADACGGSPAHSPLAIRAGASTDWDERANFSNYGTCVDLFAPGTYIRSTWNDSNSGTYAISGTSMASPHVAGVAALYLEKNKTASPAQVKSALINGSVTGKLKYIGSGSPNRLLNTLFLNP